MNADFAWQPRFHDHIIRSGAEFEEKSIYIANKHLFCDFLLIFGQPYLGGPTSLFLLKPVLLPSFSDIKPFVYDCI
jgi:hypothetical protein